MYSSSLISPPSGCPSVHHTHNCRPLEYRTITNCWNHNSCGGYCRSYHAGGCSSSGNCGLLPISKKVSERDIQMCTQFSQYMCNHTRYYDLYSVCLFHCRNQPSEYDVDYTEGGNDVKLQKSPAYDTVQLSGCTSSSAPEYENVQLQTV